MSDPGDITPVEPVESQSPVRSPTVWPVPVWPARAIRAGWWIVAAGSIVRLRSYLFDRSLWLDEAMLALNLIRRDFAGLARPLDNNQGAPILFLWAEKLCLQLFGPSEYALRLVPLLAGILTLVLSLLLARRMLGPRAGLIFVGMIAVSKPLLYYSTDLKQYECDTAAALLIVLMAVRVIQTGGWRNLAGWGAACIAAVWISHPSPFVIAASTVAIVVAAFTNSPVPARRAAIILIAVIVAVAASASFACNYWLFDRELAANHYLRTFWAPAFMPLKSAGKALLWFPLILQSACEIPFGKTGWIPLSVAMVFGGLLLIRQRRCATAILILGPAALAFVAAVAQIYPFADRLLCFTVPMMALAATIGIDWVRSRLPEKWACLALIALVWMLAEPSVQAARLLVAPRGYQEIKPVVQFIVGHRQAGDTILAVNESRMAFEFYAPRFGISEREFEPFRAEGDDAAVRHDVEQLRGRGRVWIVFAAPGIERLPKEARLMAALRDNAAQLDEFDAEGARTLLFQMNSQP